jgi:fatty-acyl-CoA synthase
VTRQTATHGASAAHLTALREATVGSLLADAVRQWPDRTALQWPTPEGLAALSWQQVWTQATTGAATLGRASNTSAPVAIYAPNSAAWYVALWAAALSGRPMVPINPALTEPEVRFLLADCGATTVLAARDYRGRDLLDAVPDLPTVAEVWDLENWVTATAAHVDVEVQPHDTFVIQYTSGTTGTPKGAVLSHRACVGAAATMVPGWEPADYEICCSPLPLHHIGALVAHALAMAVIGATYVMLTDASASHLVDAAARSRATMLGGVPTIYLRLLDEPRLPPLPDLRLLMLGGASIPPALVAGLEDRFGARVSVMYGQSEAPAITQTRLDDTAEVKAHTVGRALPHREIRIIDTSTGKPAATGQIGEICVRTPIRMERYHHRPDATSATIDVEGWLHTGDLGSLDADGLLRFHGRLRDMIVRGGENIYAREVETAIESHPDVGQAAVVGLPDPKWGEIVAAAVVARAGAAVSEDGLRDWVASRLASYKRPARWHITDDLPSTASGKPQKFRIVEMLDANQ